jgi:hypothetical protein
MSALALAALLSACGGAGAGDAPAYRPTVAPAATAVPVVAGTEQPKQYNPGKTADPNASPEDYVGY